MRSSWSDLILASNMHVVVFLKYELYKKNKLEPNVQKMREHLELYAYNKT